jgi:septal ring factor EnvC (AmiA/AmiB activator)
MCGVYVLAECPNCGTEVVVAAKCWTVAPAKLSATGYVPEFRVGIFECPNCKSKFRSRVDPQAKSADLNNVKVLVERIQEIREGLKRTLRVLREKIERLETERASLLVDIEKLKKVAEARANALEVDVKELREELRSLRKLLGVSEERD